MTTDPFRRPTADRAVRWAAMAVASAAAVVTALGLYQVATAAGVPPSVGWLYPVITDGLALLSYAASTRLHRRERSYAAGIVVIAAGLSGVAQAVHLAGGLENPSGPPIALRLGVGAWPAIAAAVAAHLLHLIRTGVGDQPSSSGRPASVQSAPDSSEPSSRVSDPPASSRLLDGAGVPLDSGPVVSERSTAVRGRDTELDVTVSNGRQAGVRTARTGSARDRAAEVARRHRDRHAGLPTTTELARLADTSRSTAGAALKALRAERGALRVVNGIVAADFRPASSGDSLDVPDRPSQAQADP